MRGTRFVLTLTAVLVAAATGGLVVAQDPGAAGVYTNEDLDSLPAPGNSTLPAAEQGQGAATSQIAGRPVPAAASGADARPERAQPATPGGGTDPLEWLQSRRSQAERELRIAEARRRVDRSVEEVARLQRGFRAEGSAFADRSSGGSDEMFVRGVTDDDRAYDRDLRAAYEEMAAARLALSRLLAAEPAEAAER
jgi:hypothetical protein